MNHSPIIHQLLSSVLLLWLARRGGVLAGIILPEKAPLISHRLDDIGRELLLYIIVQFGRPRHEESIFLCRSNEWFSTKMRFVTEDATYLRSSS